MDDVLKPEECYETWAFVFSSTLEPYGDYVKLVPDFIRLMKIISETDFLPSPLEEHTYEFLHVFIPSEIPRLLDLGFLQQNELKIVLKLFEGFIKLIPWAFSHDYLDIVNKLLLVFTQDATIYRSNGEHERNCVNGVSVLIPKHRNNLMKTFAKEPFNSLTFRLCSINTPPTLEHFELYFNMLSMIIQFLDSSIAPIDCSIESFIKFVNQFDSKTMRKLDTTKLKMICASIIEYFECFPYNIQEIVTDFLEFGEKCVYSDTVEKKIIGANALGGITSIKIDAVDVWFKTTKILDYILDHNLHTELLFQLQNIIPKLMTPDKLPKLWNITRNAHSTDRNLMLKIVTDSLKLMDVDIESFIHSISIEEDLDSEMLLFLANIAISFSNNNQNLSKQICDSIFVLTLKESYQEKTQNAIKCLASNASEELKLHIINFFQDQLSNPEMQKFSVNVFELIFERSVLSPDTFDSKEFLSNLSQIMFQEGSNRSVLYPIILKIMRIYSKKLKCSMIRKLSNVLDDDAFNFIHAAFKQRGVCTMSDNALIELMNLFSLYDMTKATIAFIDALVLSICMKNVRENKVILAPKKADQVPIDMKHFPLSNIDLLFRAYAQAVDENVAEYAENKIICIHQQYCETSVKTATLQILNYVKETNNDRGYKLLLDFILKAEYFYELKDLGYFRHKEKLFYNKIRITIKYNNQSTQITVRPSMPPAILKDRIAKKYHVTPSGINLWLYQRSVSMYNTISEAGIKEGSIITVNISNSNDNGNNTLPSIVLASNQFHEKLLQNADNPIVWRILKLLPSNNELVELSDDPVSFINKMNEAKSDHIICYMMQILSGKMNEPYYSQKFNKNDGYDMLVDLMLSRELSNKTLHEFLGMFHCRFNYTNLIQRCFELVPFCMNLIANDYPLKIITNAVTILLHYIDIDSVAITELINDNINKLVTAIDKADSNIQQYLIELIKCMTNKTALYQICKTKINEENLNPNFVEVFSILVGECCQQEDIEGILQNCIRMLNQSSGATMIGLCHVIEKIFKSNELLVQTNLFLLKDLLTFAVNIDDDQIQSTLFTLCEFICRTKEAKEIAAEILSEAVLIKTDRFNYHPESNVKNILGYVGLRNLGSTCYMNSIFQQLFHNESFCKQIITTEFEEESDKCLQRLFSEMLLLQKKTCDTQPFCLTWKKGWMKRLISTKEQQDANEFFNLLLDNLPEEIQQLYQGKIENVIQGITDEYKSSNMENFYSLGLDVNGMKNLKESFAAFSQNEILSGENQYFADTLQKKINAKKFALINELPPNLVIQLKRFEYSVQTLERVKINSRFEFPIVLKMEEYFPEKKEVYHLTGVVLHAGTVGGGHYTSLVRLKNQWFLFDDGNVSTLSDVLFEDETFGGFGSDNDFNASANAYLLFYSQEKYDQNDLKMFIKPEIAAEIEQSNLIHQKMQIAFSLKIMNFSCYISVPHYLFEYYILIFMHSNLSGYVMGIETSLMLVIDYEWSLDYVLENFESIRDIFINCSDEDLLMSLSNVMSKIIMNTSCERSYPMIEKIIDVLYAVSTMYRQLTFPSRIINAFISMDDEHCIYALERDWTKRIYQFISHVFTQTKSSVFLQNVDLSPLFDALYALVAHGCVDSCLSGFQNIAISIFSSQQQSSSFCTLVQKLHDYNIIDLVTLTISFAQYTKDANSTELASLFCNTLISLQDSAQISLLCSSIKPSKLAAIVRQLIDEYLPHNIILRSFLLEHANETLISWLTEDEDYMRQSTEMLVCYLFADVKAPKSAYFSDANINKYKVSPTYSSLKDCLELKAKFEDFLRNIFLPNPRKYFKQLSCLPECSYRLVPLLRLYYWIVKRFGLNIDKNIDLFVDVLKAIGTNEDKSDHNMFYCLRIIVVQFNPSIVEPYIDDILNIGFRHVKQLDSYEASPLLCLVWQLISSLSNEHIIKFINSSEFEDLFYISAKCNYSSKFAPTLSSIIFKVKEIPELIERVSVMFFPENEFAVLDSSFSVSFELFEAVFEKLPPNNKLNFILWLFNFTGKQSGFFCQSSIELVMGLIPFFGVVNNFLYGLENDVYVIPIGGIIFEKIVAFLSNCPNNELHLSYLHFVFYFFHRIPDFRMKLFEAYYTILNNNTIDKVPKRFISTWIELVTSFCPHEVNHIFVCATSVDKRYMQKFFSSFNSILDKSDEMPQWAFDFMFQFFFSEEFSKGRNYKSFYERVIYTYGPVEIIKQLLKSHPDLKETHDDDTLQKISFVESIDPSLHDEIQEIFEVYNIGELLKNDAPVISVE